MSEDSKNSFPKDRETIEKNLRDAVKEGRLNLTAYNSNFIEMWYLMNYCDTKVIVNGEEHGPGWIAASMPNIETIRVIWSKIRNEKQNKTDEEILNES